MILDNLVRSLQTHKERFPLERAYALDMIEFLGKNREKSFHNYHWEDGHITASMLVVNEDYTRILLMFHKKLQRWLQFGGHSDDSPDVLATAIREFHEESGIESEPKIFSYYPQDILPVFDLDIHDIPPDLKGRPKHKHYDIRFLGIIPYTSPFSRQVEEVEDMRWFDINEIGKYIEEEGLLRMIEKLEKL